MTSPGARTAASTLDLSRRDLTLDLTRVFCVLLVVVIHLLMTAVGPGPDGALIATRPLIEQGWYVPATWIGQIMPLFFVVGGFAAATGWGSWTRKGGDAAGYVRNRTLRLAQPTLPLFLFFAVVLSAVTLAGLAPELVAAAAIGVGSPLWFIAAYLVCQAATPFLLGQHRRAPRLTLLAMLAGVVAVDIARYATGITEIGLLNLLFVWPLIHQFGFWYKDGWFDRRHPLTLVALAAVCYLALWPLTSIGWYHADMLDNLNPPTVPLVLLGLAQACLLRLAKRPLTWLMSLRPMQGAVFVIGSRLMTVYLWHLPVILAVTGVSLLIPGAAPAPDSAAWWWSRPIMFAVVLVVLYGLTLLIARWEAVRNLGPTPSVLIVAIGVVLAFLPPFAILQWNLSLWIAVGGAVCLAIAVPLLRGRRSLSDAASARAGSLEP